VRCPVCRADNAAGPQCRRCKADLSLLFTLDGQRQSLLARAVEMADRGEWLQASDLAAEAHGLRRDEDSRRLLASARLMQGDFEGAWQAYSDSGRA
jgi:hypothetical protein